MNLMLLFLLLTLAPLSSMAQSDDAHKIANIASDSVEYNNKTGIAKYIGHVHAKQGTTQMDADKVTLLRNKNHQIDTIIALGNPAHYTTLPDHERKILDAKAQVIEYYPQSGKVVLKQNATVKMGDNTFSGPHIIYNMKQQTVVSLPSKNNQTHIVITPEPKASHTS